MTQYEKKAESFLKSAKATMKFSYMGLSTFLNTTDKELRNSYKVIIKTPQGQMTVNFYDSINNTINGEEPTSYDILACLQKYDVGSFENFVSEFGYDIEEYDDLKRTKKIYNAVLKEYQNIKRCFTDEQIEAMQDIN